MTTRIVVLADTHMPRSGRVLPEAVIDAARSADLIVHLGDFTGPEVAEYLGTLGPLAAVHGNNDSQAIRARFPASRLLEIEGHRVALIHGHEGGRTANAAAKAVAGADVVLFGHSHVPTIVREDGRLLFNPGSPTERRFAPHRSFGILDLGVTAEASLIQLP